MAVLLALSLTACTNPSAEPEERTPAADTPGVSAEPDPLAGLPEKKIDASEAELSDFIVIDQFGYRPGAQKTAVVRNPKTGPDADLSFTPGNIYHIVDETGGASVYYGAPEHKFDEDPHSGDEIWWFDFSSVDEPGRYFVYDEQKNARSFSFTIAEDVYNEVLKHAVRMFYYQRAGFEKKAEFAGEAWTDAASHLGPGQDTQARSFHDKDNAAAERDLSGGWYDAGDYNKYTPWTARYIEAMLNMYRERPGAFGDDYNIPESGNGVPDLLDEARWGMDYLLKLQENDGSVISVVGLSHASPPSAAKDASYYGKVNTTSALGAARAFALGAVVFAEWDGSYAETLREAAERAWAWAEANPDVMYQNNSAEYGSSGLAAGGQEIESDDTGSRTENRLYAAMYMYEMTGDKTYLQQFDADYKKFPLFMWSNVMDMYRGSQHLMFFHYMNLPDATPSVAEDIKKAMVTAFNKPNNNAGKLGEDGYRSYMEAYNWGSNLHKADYGLTFYYWAQYQMEDQPDEIYLNAAQDYLHYIHGVNPFNWVYLTNMGDFGASRSLTTIYHTWFAPGTGWDKTGVSEHGPAPGYLPGGANQYYNVQSGFPDSLNGYTPTPEEMELGNYIRDELAGSPPLKMYMDINHSWPINSWEITEPSCGYQLGYIRLLSKFVQLQDDPVTLGAP
jgi:hypothetical protein